MIYKHSLRISSSYTHFFGIIACVGVFTPYVIYDKVYLCKDMSGEIAHENSGSKVLLFSNILLDSSYTLLHFQRFYPNETLFLSLVLS